MALNKDYIPLRALIVREGAGKKRAESHGVALPDGRIVLFGFRGYAIATYSSERNLLKYHPGATIEWQSEDVNQTINHVDPDDV